MELDAEPKWRQLVGPFFFPVFLHPVAVHTYTLTHMKGTQHSHTRAKHAATQHTRAMHTAWHDTKHMHTTHTHTHAPPDGPRAPRAGRTGNDCRPPRHGAAVPCQGQGLQRPPPHAQVRACKRVFVGGGRGMPCSCCLSACARACHACACAHVRLPGLMVAYALDCFGSRTSAHPSVGAHVHAGCCWLLRACERLDSSKMMNSSTTTQQPSDTRA